MIVIKRITWRKNARNTREVEYLHWKEFDKKSSTNITVKKTTLLSSLFASSTVSPTASFHYEKRLGITDCKPKQDSTHLLERDEGASLLFFLSFDRKEVPHFPLIFGDERRRKRRRWRSRLRVTQVLSNHSFQSFLVCLLSSWMNLLSIFFKQQREDAKEVDKEFLKMHIFNSLSSCVMYAYFMSPELTYTQEMVTK